MSLLKDRVLQDQLVRYFELARDQQFENPTEDFFSFRRGLTTIMLAIQDLFLAFSYLPDEPLVREVWQEMIRPLELQCILEFDRLPHGHELKQQTCKMVDNIYQALENKTAGIRVKADLLKPSALARREAQKTKGPKPLLVRIWEVVSHPRATGFWNNQAGAQSAMTRVLTAYARSRNYNVPSDRLRWYYAKSLEQLKIYIVHARRYILKLKLKHGMTEVLEEYTELTLRGTSRRPRQLINMRKREASSRLAEAHPIVNTLACGIQLVVAVQGIREFFSKPKPKPEDYVRLVDSVSNGGLALSGMPKKVWERALIKEAGRQLAGHTLSAISFISQAYYASLEMLDHHRYGDRFLCRLSWFRVILSTLGAMRHLVLAFGGCSISGPVGWVVFVGLIIVELATYLVKKATPGTENVLDELVRRMDQNQTAKLGITQSADFRVIHDHRPVIYTERKFIPENDPDRKLCLDRGKVVETSRHKLRKRSYTQRIDYRIRGLSQLGLMGTWNHTIIKTPISMAPLGLETMPCFIAAGWSKESLVKLYYPGTVAALSLAQELMVKRAVRRFYDEWIKIRRTRPDLVVRRRAELLRGRR